MVPPCRTRVPDGGSKIAKGLAIYNIYMPLVTGTTECTTFGEPFGGGSGSDGGSIPAVNDVSVLILPRCNIAPPMAIARKRTRVFRSIRGSWMANRPIDTIAQRRKSRLPKRAATATPRRNKGSLRLYEAHVAAPYGHRVYCIQTTWTLSPANGIVRSRFRSSFSILC